MGVEGDVKMIVLLGSLANEGMRARARPWSKVSEVVMMTAGVFSAGTDVTGLTFLSDVKVSASP